MFRHKADTEEVLGSDLQNKEITRTIIVHRSVNGIRLLLIYMITAQLDGQMKSHIDGQTRHSRNIQITNSRNIHKNVKPLRRTDRKTDIRSDGVDFISQSREILS